MSRSVALLPLFLSVATAVFPQANPVHSSCIECHSKTTPAVVAEWKKSKHGKLSCDTCHETDHQTADDAKLAKFSTAPCLQCHV